jgi:hypothetical protein
MLEPFSISALGVFIATACLALSGFVAAVCSCLAAVCTTHTHINACCMSCDRDVLNENEIEIEPRIENKN